MLSEVVGLVQIERVKDLRIEKVIEIGDEDIESKNCWGFGVCAK